MTKAKSMEEVIESVKWKLSREVLNGEMIDTSEYYAKALKDAGFIHRDSIPPPLKELDEDELYHLLNEWRDKGAMQYTGNVAHAIVKHFGTPVQPKGEER